MRRERHVALEDLVNSGRPYGSNVSFLSALGIRNVVIDASGLQERRPENSAASTKPLDSGKYAEQCRDPAFFNPIICKVNNYIDRTGLNGRVETTHGPGKTHSVLRLVTTFADRILGWFNLPGCLTRSHTPQTLQPAPACRSKCGRL